MVYLVVITDAREEDRVSRVMSLFLFGRKAAGNQKKLHKRSCCRMRDSKAICLRVAEKEVVCYSCHLWKRILGSKY